MSAGDWRAWPDVDPLVTELAGRLRGQVAEQLAARLRELEAAGRPRPGIEDQRRLARELIAQALDTEAQTALAAGRPVLGMDQEERLAHEVLAAVFGLGRLETLLSDPQIENININGHDRVHLRYADGTRQQLHEPIAGSDAELVELLRTAAARLGLVERRFDQASPALSLQLPDGSRLFAVMAVTGRVSLAIRRHRYPRIILKDLTKLGTLTPGLAEVLAAAVRASCNLIVAGDTGAGKTTMLRALASEIPAPERLITIEDTLELGLDQWPQMHPDVVAMEAREANVEGAGAVGQAELVRWALRMSPDRVIVGEVRGDEVIPMLNAMSMGTDGSMCTLHASSSAGVFGKLATYALQAPERLTLEATSLLVGNAVHLVVFIDHDRATGRRVVASVREVVGAEGTQVVSNEVLHPGADTHAVPAAPLRAPTLERLVAAGLDPSVLDRADAWWAPPPPHSRKREVGW